MKRYRLMYRGIRNMYYSVDTTTNKRESLGTGNEAEAQRLLDTKNEAVHHAEMNLQIAQVYLQHSDPTLSKRTWQDVMEAMTPLKNGPTLKRWKRAIMDTAFDLIRKRKLMETNSHHFLQILNAGTVSTNMFLRRIHNFAVGMHWLPWPVLPKLQWPRVKHKDRRAITAEEHARIVQRERNPEIRAYYQLLWHLGGSQSDNPGLLPSPAKVAARFVACSADPPGEFARNTLPPASPWGQALSCPRCCEPHSQSLRPAGSPCSLPAVLLHGLSWIYLSIFGSFVVGFGFD